MSLYVRYRVECDWCGSKIIDDKEYKLGVGDQIPMPSHRGVTLALGHACETCMDIAIKAVNKKTRKK